MNHTRAHGRVVSHTPGRVRVRLHDHRAANSKAVLHRARDHLENQEGIGHVAVSGAGTSVLVHFDPRRLSCDEILGLLADVGLLVKDLGEASEESVTDLGHSETANSLIRALDDLDRRIARLTGHQVDLKLLVPVGMAALGVLQVARDGLGITQVPGYVLLWYAFDAFYKLHRSPPVQAADDHDQPADASADCESTPR